jgi:hypothetical protein
MEISCTKIYINAVPTRSAEWNRNRTNFSVCMILSSCTETCANISKYEKEYRPLLYTVYHLKVCSIPYMYKLLTLSSSYLYQLVRILI